MSIKFVISYPYQQTIISIYNQDYNRMLKFLTRAPLYFARRISRPREQAVVTEDDDKNQAVKSKTIQSEYQQMKQMFENIDKNESKDTNDDKNFDRSIGFIRKMLEEEARKDQAEEKTKQKPKIEDKLRRIGTPEGLLTNKQVRPQRIKEVASHKDFKSSASISPQENPLIQSIMAQTGKTIDDLQQDMNRQLKLAQQDVMLEQIMKKSKQKEVKLDLAVSPPVQNEKQNEKRLILRREKIIEALQKKTDPSEAKFELTSQDLLNMKYSPEILAKAHQYKNYELSYFKQLIINDQNENNRNSLMNKRHYKDQKDQKKYLQESKKVKAPKEIIENSYQNIKHEEGLRLFEDEQFYKDKAIRQIKEKVKLTSEDLKLKEELAKDLQLGDEMSDVFLDEVVYPLEAKIERRIAYRDTSFGRQDTQIKELDKKLKNLGLEFNQEQIKSLSTQLLFEEKHLLEEQQGFQKYLQRKEKKKNMKKELRETHKNVLRDDLNFDKQEQSSMSVKEIREASDVSLLEDNYEKLQEYEARKQATLVTDTPQQRQTQIHRKKTFKNLQNFIVLYFGNGLLNHNANQLKDIQILQIIPNASNTVLNIFWNISADHVQKMGVIPGSNNYEQEFQKLKRKLEQRLKNQSGYISGKMTQLLRLRYGPQIRFYFDTKTKKTRDAIEELGKFTKEIAMVQLEQYQKKGLIKGEEESVEYYEKLLNVAKGKLSDFNSRSQLLSKTAQKHVAQVSATNEAKQIKSNAKVMKQASGNIKRKRKNPMFEEEESNEPSTQKMGVEIKRKKRPSDRLWDSIDLL